MDEGDEVTDHEALVYEQQRQQLNVLEAAKSYVELQELEYGNHFDCQVMYAQLRHDVEALKRAEHNLQMESTL